MLTPADFARWLRRFASLDLLAFTRTQLEANLPAYRQIVQETDQDRDRRIFRALNDANVSHLQKIDGEFIEEIRERELQPADRVEDYNGAFTRPELHPRDDPHRDARILEAPANAAAELAKLRRESRETEHDD